MLLSIDAERCCAARPAKSSRRNAASELLDLCFKACRHARRSRAMSTRTRAFLVTQASRSDGRRTEEQLGRLLNSSTVHQARLRTLYREPSCSEGARNGSGFIPWGNRLLTASLLLSLSVGSLEALSAILPPASRAAETVSVEAFGSFLDGIENLGPLAPVAFVATVVAAEMIPLFPTQPLSIASGLLFGTPKGAALALLGTSTAAVLAFQLSRGVGRRLADKVISEELSGEGQRESGAIFARVQAAVDSGSFQQQLIAITLLRLTPVVPFSASNYLLGLTPLKFPAYLVGSLIGLSFWTTLFSALGGASRDLLKSGLSLDVLLSDLLAEAGAYTSDAAVVALVVGVVVLLLYLFGPLQPDKPLSSDSDKHDEHRKEDLGRIK